MSDKMTFPETWEEFEKSYGFDDSEEIYTNGSRLIPSFRVKQWLDHESKQNDRLFVELVVEYPSISTYKEYKGKPYFSIKYIENGEKYIGYGTYKPEVLSQYLKEYFLPSAEPEHLVKESGDLVKDLVNDCINRKDAIDAINAYLGLSAVSRTIQNMTSIQEILEKLPAVDTDLSTFSDKLWKIAYERGKEEGQTEAWEFAIDAYYGTTKEQELFECLTFTQAKTEREELGKCEEKNNAGQIFVELANHINRCINDAVKKTREGEEE